MVFAGERFTLDLDDEDEDAGAKGAEQAPLSVPGVQDVREREICAPPPPKAKKDHTGFPARRKRRDVPSVRDDAASSRLRKGEGNGDDDGVKEQIDRENRQRLEAMTPEEIGQEQRELEENLPRALVERIRRGRIDGDTSLGEHPKNGHAQQSIPASSIPSMSAPTHSTLPDTSSSTPPLLNNTATIDAEDAPKQMPELFPTTSPPPTRIHFPAPGPAPELDPSDPGFLDSLHEKYFPTLAPDPSKLAWMQPGGSPEASTSPAPPDAYSAASAATPNSTQRVDESVLPSQIRFSFRGTLLAPLRSASIPGHLGLHHHADAPGAGGYTIPELARLARSAYPAQRCLAYQTLGRVLYRLGRGEFGPDGSDLVMGLWKCVDDGGVIKSLTDEAGDGTRRKDGGDGGEEEKGDGDRDGGTGEANRREQKHVSAQAHAQEALWNWQRGGGRRWKAQ